MARGQNNRQEAQENGTEEGRKFYAGEPDVPHVMLTFVDEDGRETPASVAKNCEQSDLTLLYRMISGVYTNMFTYNGAMIEPGQTVESLGMQDGDIVRVGGFPTFSFAEDVSQQKKTPPRK